MTQLCEYEGCVQPAEGYVEAQWSVADFVRYEGCIRHLAVMRMELGEHQVDGCLPDTHSALYWDIEEAP